MYPWLLLFPLSCSHLDEELLAAETSRQESVRIINNNKLLLQTLQKNNIFEIIPYSLGTH